MRINLINPAAVLRRNEDGQMAILMVLVLPVVFLLFALALDAGVWFFRPPAGPKPGRRGGPGRDSAPAGD